MWSKHLCLATRCEDDGGLSFPKESPTGTVLKDVKSHVSLVGAPWTNQLAQKGLVAVFGFEQGAGRAAELQLQAWCGGIRGPILAPSSPFRGKLGADDH